MPRALRFLLAGVALVAALVTLAWFDVLPGGWTLRGLVEPHHVREAREQRQRSDARLALFAAENAGLPADTVVFLGSSTIERFALDEAFPGKLCVNRGIGNETAVELFERIPASLPAAEPAAFVLYAGSLDFRRERKPAEVVVERVARCVRRLRELTTEGVPVTLIGLLPERDMDFELRGLLERTNVALSNWAARSGIGFVATDRPPLRTATGSLAESYSADRLHLNAAGYEVLAQWLLADHPVANHLRD